jgi:hypothetical protein
VVEFFAKTTATSEVIELNGNNYLACLGHLGQQDTNSIGSICACHPGWPKEIKPLLPLISMTIDVVSVFAEKNPLPSFMLAVYVHVFTQSSTRNYLVKPQKTHCAFCRIICQV